MELQQVRAAYLCCHRPGYDHNPIPFIDQSFCFESLFGFMDVRIGLSDTQHDERTDSPIKRHAPFNGFGMSECQDRSARSLLGDQPNRRPAFAECHDRGRIGCPRLS